MTRLHETEHREPPWSDRYPQPAEILADGSSVPKGNRIRRDISFRGTWLTFGTPEAAHHIRDRGENVVGVDPHLRDPRRRDFRLEPDSPAAQIGCEGIPWETIGPNRAVDFQ
jgi:hypothetical protein